MKIALIGTTDSENIMEDLQTSLGVDIAEQIAANTALENAADVLAERLLPPLAR